MKRFVFILPSIHVTLHVITVSAVVNFFSLLTALNIFETVDIKLISTHVEFICHVKSINHPRPGITYESTAQHMNAWHKPKLGKPDETNLSSLENIQESQAHPKPKQKYSSPKPKQKV